MIRRSKAYPSDERGAVTAEKAILTLLVIVFAWAGIRFLSDPLRDPVFRVILAIIERIYETVAPFFFR
ncbi:MAG TPA: hypothetical protein VF312_08320 [Propionibacteriaceae bacterium]